ncbi:hypothetical protein [Streptomyces sp. SYP-A7185]|uniref:hypothetical protein n=1 Tax=Streptomyces sp. SYP-A7185 TaxID=3040076 RepID=UPI0038F706BE
MRKISLRRAPAAGRSVVVPVVAAAVVALSAAAAVAGNSVWNGEPYPSADPDAVAQRLNDRSDEVYDGFGLPDTYAAAPGRVDTGACSYRGLRGFAHVDEARSDVRSFGLDWSVPHVPEATARDAQERVRRQLVERGWKRTHDWGRRTGASSLQLGFRFEDPRGDQVDVQWNDATTTLFISVYAPCGQVPDTFDEHRWPAADWDPRESAPGL